MAWKALFDRKVNFSGEMEFGGAFPLGRIIQLIEGNASIVDVRLVQLARQADHSTYENHDDVVTAEELALFDYVADRTIKLGRKYG